MIAELLLASAIALPSSHSPVQTASQTAVVRHESSARIDAVKIDFLAYCDASRQPTIVLSNVGFAAVVVAWTLTAVLPGRGTDVWSNVSLIGSGHFEGWMSPAASLSLVARYDDDGQPTTRSVEATCPAIAGDDSGLDD